MNAACRRVLLNVAIVFSLLCFSPLAGPLYGAWAIDYPGAGEDIFDVGPIEAYGTGPDEEAFTVRFRRNGVTVDSASGTCGGPGAGEWEITLQPSAGEWNLGAATFDLVTVAGGTVTVQDAKTIDVVSSQ